MDRSSLVTNNFKSNKYIELKTCMEVSYLEAPEW